MSQKLFADVAAVGLFLGQKFYMPNCWKYYTTAKAEFWIKNRKYREELIYNQ